MHSYFQIKTDENKKTFCLSFLSCVSVLRKIHKLYLISIYLWWWLFISFIFRILILHTVRRWIIRYLYSVLSFVSFILVYYWTLQFNQWHMGSWSVYVVWHERERENFNNFRIQLVCLWFIWFSCSKLWMLLVPRGRDRVKVMWQPSDAIN